MAFSKGISGNPSGRPAGIKSAKMARVSKKDAAAALMFLSATLKDEGADTHTRAIAAAALLGAVRGERVTPEPVAV